MLRLSNIVDQLHALIGDDVDVGGAHTALLVNKQSSDIYAYASKDALPVQLNDQHGLMNDLPVSLTSPEDYARRLAAVATASWREQHTHANDKLRSSRRRLTSPERNLTRRLDAMVARDMGLHRNGATWQRGMGTGGTSDLEECAISSPEGDAGDADLGPPVLVVCEYGRIVVASVRIPSLHGQEKQRLRRGPSSRVSRQGSRHQSFTNNSNSSVPVEVSALRQSVSRHALSEDAMDQEFSTEEETDMDSMRSEGANWKRDAVHDTPLLVLCAPQTEEDSSVSWQTLLSQANIYAEIQNSLSLQRTFTSMDDAPAPSLSEKESL
ncbi:hypothetical protein ACI68E_002585 [Malassezia pachydermatis]|uniref:Uncharacterized protein n=1 Tax=Malassezia pachydermatis TaxID=77020 RepID=A0A0M8MIZ2_9BASI|nr:hypothetical protein Malapachy_2902 [Malassezia pachydermatis]KOS12478.1 hypothetical protein Malapachy_2902 [Malassezia pachydermatis]